jgi:hypothetical protein
MSASASVSARFAEYMRERAAVERFDWRRHNCAHFVADWVRVATGVDPLADLRGVQTLDGWHQAAGPDLRAAVTARLGVAPKLPTLAQCGDVVLLPAAVFGALSICAGRTAAGLTPRGEVVHVPMTEAVCAWSLPRPGIQQ